MTREKVVRLVRNAAYLMALATRYPAHRRRRGAAIFAFHNVMPDDSIPARCDRSLHVTLSDFQDYLGVIADGHTVVPLDEIAARVRQRRSVDGLAALTFDDAYRGVMIHAAPLLARRALPATVFVVSGAAAAPAPFWWDLIGSDGGLTEGVRNHALNHLQGARDLVLAEHDVSEFAMPTALLPACWDDVRTLARDGMTIGSHTVSHRNLTAIGGAAVEQELERARAEIGAVLGAPPVEVAYPYGLLNGSVIEAAGRAGYTTGVTLQFGLVTRDTNTLALPRINVPAGISLPALECWAAGLRLRSGI